MKRLSADGRSVDDCPERIGGAPAADNADFCFGGEIFLAFDGGAAVATRSPNTGSPVWRSPIYSTEGDRVREGVSSILRFLE